jgi:C-terminal processing protease CtpA/Prc
MDLLRQITRSLLFPLGMAAAVTTASAASLTPDQARRDAGILVQTLRALHPALDKYNTPAEVDAHFKRFDTRALAAKDSADMYLAATELAAAVRCGHTWTNVLNQQGETKKRLIEAADKLPLTMALVEGRWLVLASAVPLVRAGDEIVSINAMPGARIVAEMLPYLRADGASDGKRLRQLSHDRPDYSMMDIVWPLLSPPSDGSYRLGLRRGSGAVQDIEVKAMTLAARSASLAAQGVTPVSEAWSLRIDGDRAVLRLPTFSVYRSGLDWKKFLADSFAELKAKQVAHLIIDIRANEGGDGAIGLALLGYLVKEPMNPVSDQSVTSYERVPYKLARYLDTWDFSFFDRTGLVDRIAQGPQAGRYKFRPNAMKVNAIAPQADRFTGRTWLLVGPENSSAAFLLAKLAKQAGAATLVGQATGGNERGLNGGQLAWVTLPHSGVAVDVPLLATSYQADTPDASVTPDLVVPPRFVDRAAGRDREMEAVGEAIQRTVRPD